MLVNFNCIQIIYRYTIRACYRQCHTAYLTNTTKNGCLFVDYLTIITRSTRNTLRVHKKEIQYNCII